MSPLGLILITGAGTYLIRVSAIAMAGRIEVLPARVETMLAMIPPAVLAAIAAQSLVFDGDQVRGFDEWHLALAVAARGAARTRNMALCLAVGMSLVWILAAIG